MCYGKYYNMIIVFVCKYDFDYKGVIDLECMVVNVIFFVLIIVKMIYVIYKMGFVFYVNVDGLEYYVK